VPVGLVWTANKLSRGASHTYLKLEMALERERVLLSVSSESDRQTLLRLLKRVHENLAAVETATAGYIARRYPRAAGRRPGAVNDLRPR
jgi:hypothetical protein